MSTAGLVQIPFEDDDYHHDDIECSSPSETFHNIGNNRKDNDNDNNNKNENEEEPEIIHLGQIFSPSETYKHSNHLYLGHNKQQQQHQQQHINNSRSNDLVRIVSSKECLVLKNNIIRVLRDNNFDILYEFNLSEFLIIFKKILPLSPDEEIIKLFDLLLPSNKNTNKLSFDCIINNNNNFKEFIESMGCIMDNDEDDGNTNNNNKKYELFPNKSMNVTPRYSPNIQREYNTNKPILNWRNGNISNHNLSLSLNINNTNYMEYIEYQRDMIENLRNEINDIYKPIILNNKELEINLESLLKENITLKQENKTMENEINLLEEELNQISNINGDYNNNHKLDHIITRRISSSFAEIQESHEYLENEIISLKNNLKMSRKESGKTYDENNKLQEMNEKYIKLNDKLRNNLNVIRKELSILKLQIERKNDEINNLKCDLFEKDQSNQGLNSLITDLYQQIQFYSNNNNRKRPKSKKKSFDFKINSVRSLSSYRNSEFDIFNDLLLSPKKNNVISPNNHYYEQSLSTNTTNTGRKRISFSNDVIINNYNNNYNMNELNTFKSELELLQKHDDIDSDDINDNDNNDDDDDVDDNKDEIIQILRNDINELQKKMDNVIIESRIELERSLRIELEQEIRNKIKNEQIFENKKTKKRMRSIGTQTKVLGFWEKLFSELRCIPIDEDYEW